MPFDLFRDSLLSEVRGLASGWLSVTDDPDPAGGGGGGDELEDIDPSGETDPDRQRILEALKKEREARKAEKREMSNLKAQLQLLQSKLDPAGQQAVQQQINELSAALQAKDQEIADRLKAERAKAQQQAAALIQERDTEKAARAAEALRVAGEKAYMAAGGKMAASEDGVTDFDYFWDKHAAKFGRDEVGLFVKDTDGEPLMDEDEPRKRLSPVKFLEKMRADPVHGKFFDPQRGAGSGSRNGRDGRHISVQDRTQRSVSQAFRDRFGPNR